MTSAMHARAAPRRRGRLALDAKPSVLPGFGLDARLHRCGYLSPDRADAAGRAGPAGERPRPRPAFWRDRDDAARAGGASASASASSLAAAAINVVFGVLVAWVLVRYDFPGKRLLDASVDLPFALPTAVAGIALAALYAPNGWIGALLDAARHQDRLHAARHLGRARLHRPALRRAHRAAGAGRARHARSRRPRPRSAPAASRPSSASCCPRSRRRSSPALRSPSRAPSANTAR